MKKFLFLIAAVGVGLSVFAAYEWENVGAADRLGGRMISAGYLRGKVVVLDRRDYGDVSKENREAIRRLQALWAAYKTKPFIVLGGHTGKAGAKRVVAVLKKLGVTYPVYADARADSADEEPRISVFDSTCRNKLYTGADPRVAGGVAGGALLSASAPATAEQYGFLLDYEIEKLPGRAYLRLKEFRSRFPEEARNYDAAWKKLAGDADVKRLAKLCELSRLVKDRDVADQKAQKLTPAMLEKTIKKYEDLKRHENPFIVQEAKNALADIKWSAATL